MSNFDVWANPQVMQGFQVFFNILFLLVMARALPSAVARGVGQIKIEFVVGGKAHEPQ